MCLVGHLDRKVLQAITTAEGSMCHLNKSEVSMGMWGGTCGKADYVHTLLPPRHLPSHCRSPRRHDSQAKQAQAPVGNALRPQGRRPRLAILPRQDTRWQVSVEFICHGPLSLLG